MGKEDKTQGSRRGIWAPSTCSRPAESKSIPHAAPWGEGKEGLDMAEETVEL